MFEVFERTLYLTSTPRISIVSTRTLLSEILEHHVYSFAMKALDHSHSNTGTSSVIERIAHSKKSRKASQKLQDVIVRDEAFALPFLILMAQQKYNIAYKQETYQLKLVSNLHDMTQRTMYQFTEFLMSSMTPSEYAKALPLPSFATMCKKYRLRHVESFHLCRPIAREALLSRWRGQEEENKMEKWDPLSESNVNVLRELMTSDIHLSPELYATFWTLSILDVSFPETLYKDAIQNLRKEIEKKTNLKPSLKSRSEIRDCTKAISKSETSLKLLREEMKAQRSCFSVVRKGLENMNFGDFDSQSFLQTCLLPRLLHDAASAMYVVWCSSAKRENFNNIPHFQRHFVVGVRARSARIQ